jgi:hypothetical protein
MEYQVSLPYSQDPTIGPYPEPHETTPHLHTLSFYTHFNITPFYVRLSLSSGFVPSDLLTKILY